MVVSLRYGVAATAVTSALVALMAAGTAASGAGSIIDAPTLESLKALDRHKYGYVHVSGAVTKYEFFRATFGALIPCAGATLVMAPDNDYEACEELPRDLVEGSIVLALRGKCQFAVKAVNAAKAGAAGLIIANTEAGLIRVPKGPTDVSSVNFPVVMVTKMCGDILASAAMNAQRAGTELAVRLEVSKDHCVDSSGVEVPNYTPAADEMYVSTGGSLFVSPETPACERSDARECELVRQQGFEYYTPEFGGVVTQGLTLEAVVADPPMACREVYNHKDAAGRIIVVQRGECPMIEKARFAQRVNAAGVVIVNTVGEGPVRAMGDDHWGDIRIPVVSITSDAWEQVAAAMEAGTTGGDGKSFPSITIVPRAIAQSPWEDLVGVRDWTPEQWGADEEALDTTIGRLLLDHHAESPAGHWERQGLLQRIVAAAGQTDAYERLEAVLRDPTGAGRAALEAVQEAVIAAEGGVDGLSRGDAPAYPFGSGDGFGLAPLLTRPLSVQLLNEDLDVFLPGELASRLRCTRLSKMTYSVTLKPLDVRSNYAPHKQIGELLRQQACLEKLLMLNAVSVGQRLNHFQATAESDEEWQKVLAKSFRESTLHLNDDRVQRVASTYRKIAHLDEARRSMLDTTSLGQWLGEGPVSGGAIGSSDDAPASGDAAGGAAASSDGEWEV